MPNRHESYGLGQFKRETHRVRLQILLPIKVISLDKSEVRRNSFIEMNEGLDYEFISAVNGSSLSEQTIANRKLFGPGLNYSTGALGNALSHLKLWELAILDNRVFTIAEDDAIFRDDFYVNANKVISLLPKDWDIILWAWNFDSILSIDFMPKISKAVMVFDQFMLRNSISNFKKLEMPSLPMRLDKCFGIPAYSISPTGAKKFKEMCFPLTAFTLHYPLLNKRLPNLGLDCAMNRIYSSTESYVCFPPLAITKNEHENSTIQIR